MKSLLLRITDFVSTKRGMRITLGVWLAVTLLLGGLAPSAKEYEVTSIDSLPEDAQSVIAQNKLDQYFESSDGLPAILVFHAKEGEADLEALKPFFEQAPETEGLKSIVPLPSLPPQAVQSFRSEDGSTVIVPIIFESSMETKELRTALEHLESLAEPAAGMEFYVTGPAGIAVDSLNLFSRADVVLILSTVGLILVLLVVIYRSPLLALIPLLASAFVYEAVNQTLGLMGAAGLVMSNQSLSIMTILLFAAVTDYSLFVFSRYRDELKHHENKYEAMKHAMRGTGVPVFFAGGTVLAAMLMLFFAEYGDYRNFRADLRHDDGDHYDRVRNARAGAVHAVRPQIVLAAHSEGRRSGPFGFLAVEPCGTPDGEEAGRHRDRRRRPADRVGSGRAEHPLRIRSDEVVPVGHAFPRGV